MHSNSAWAGNNRQDASDLAQTLRSPLFLGAAVVVVLAVVVFNFLNGERWVEAGSIAVIQDQDVLYLDDEGIFVFWNEGEPYGVLQSVDEGSQPMSFCKASGTFLGPSGEVYDPRGRPLDGRGSRLPVLPARMDGHLVFVRADRSAGSTEPGSASSTPSGPRCAVPAPDDRGLRPSP